MNDTSVNRIEAASKLLEITEAELKSKLAQMGLSEDDFNDDRVFKFCDLIDFARSPFAQKPIATMRKVYHVLRTGKLPGSGSAPPNDRVSDLKALGYRVKIDDADASTLIANYLPGKPNDPVTVALRKRFNDQKVIAFTSDGKVAIEETFNYIADLEQGFPPQDAIEVNGALERLWPVGVVPDMMLDEDPLFPGSPLRNNRSIVNQRNWSKVDFEARQLCRIIIDNDHVDTNDREAVIKLIERAEKGVKALQEIYPDDDLDFRELKKQNNLPKLKVSLQEKSKHSNNPFGVNRKY